MARLRARIEAEQVRIAQGQALLRKAHQEQDGLRAELRTLTDELDMGEARLEGFADRARDRHFVFDRSSMVSERLWTVRVHKVSTPLPPDWEDGRTYLIGAPSAREAAQAAGRRFPQAKGWALGMPVPADFGPPPTSEG